MILQGFEIENWACIKRVAVSGLPETGIAVLHGPNGTGKSSIVAALRACLLDCKSDSTSKDLRRWFPKVGNDKPRVAVTFRAHGETWRITKHFGSKDSKLEQQSAGGAWRVIQSTASDAHQQLRSLLGDKNSDQGLHQLLWVTQAKFHLPHAKDFDSDVQSQLRAALGVLQTPLDDAFIQRVKDAWSRWFGARSKPGETPRLRKDCPLDKARSALESQRAELAELDQKHQSVERMTERCSELEIVARDLRRQMDNKRGTCNVLQQEYEKSLTRLESYRLAKERVAASEQALAAATEASERRKKAEAAAREAQALADKTVLHDEEISQRLVAAEHKLRDLRTEVQRVREAEREIQAQLNQVTERREALLRAEKLDHARRDLQRVEALVAELEELKRQERERPAPDAAAIKKLAENRTIAGQLRSKLEAAAMTLAIEPQPGAAPSSLAIDGGMPVEPAPTAGTPNRFTVRRHAELTIPGWGRVKVTQGSDARSLDQLESDVEKVERAFAEAVAPYGSAAADPTALDQLRGRLAEKNVRIPRLKQVAEEVNRQAPKGLEVLREEVARLGKLITASNTPQPDTVTLAELEHLAGRLKLDLQQQSASCGSLEKQIEQLQREIDGVPGLRREASEVRDRLIGQRALAEFARAELEKMPTSAQIDADIAAANAALATAKTALEAAALTEDEETIRDRLDAAIEGLRGLQQRLGDVQEEFNQLKGAISQSEGDHVRRSEAAARVQELQRCVNHETLESDAYHRLYSLFEECREKQLGAVMGPIHDRVLRWIRLLRIGGYQSVRFNDHFLPEKLVGANGDTELLFDEESTGTIEQIALMVRLALGSTLSRPEAPVVAVLDDPLTHSDVWRLDRMRAVLKAAAAGDASSSPAAGPLQVLVLTCHPEWFAIDGATMIDLSRPEVLSRN